VKRLKKASTTQPLIYFRHGADWEIQQSPALPGYTVDKGHTYR